MSQHTQGNNKKGFIQQFFDFLKTFGVIGLAIAFVIGQASSTMVTAFVTDIINPLVGLFIPSGNLDTLSVRVTGLSGQVSDFEYGHLISNMITFIIIAFVVFIAYKSLSKMKLVEDKTTTITEEKK